MALQPGGMLHDIMLAWIKSVVERIAPPCPRGKHVTMFISHGVYCDYKARMSGMVDTSYSSWHILRKSQFAKPISRQNRLTFAIQSVSTDRVDASDWGGDRFDRPYFALLEAVRQDRAWVNRRIIFASKDKDARDRMRDLVALRDPDRRVHFADSLSSFEELVMC